MSPEQQPQPASVGEVLEYLGRPSQHGQQPIEGVLQRATDLAKAVMPSHSEVSVTLLVEMRPSTVVATGQLAVDLDEGQYESGHGPCLHAAATRETTEPGHLERDALAGSRTARRRARQSQFPLVARGHPGSAGVGSVEHLRPATERLRRRQPVGGRRVRAVRRLAEHLVHTGELRR